MNTTTDGLLVASFFRNDGRYSARVLNQLKGEYWVGYMPHSTPEEAIAEATAQMEKANPAFLHPEWASYCGHSELIADPRLWLKFKGETTWLCFKDGIWPEEVISYINMGPHVFKVARQAAEFYARHHRAITRELKLQEFWQTLQDGEVIRTTLEGFQLTFPERIKLFAELKGLVYNQIRWFSDTSRGTLNSDRGITVFESSPEKANAAVLLDRGFPIAFWTGGKLHTDGVYYTGQGHYNSSTITPWVIPAKPKA